MLSGVVLCVSSKWQTWIVRYEDEKLEVVDEDRRQHALVAHPLHILRVSGLVTCPLVELVCQHEDSRPPEEHRKQKQQPVALGNLRNG